MKVLVLEAGVRIREALIGATDETLSAVSTQDASCIFRHYGYQTAAQLL